MKQNTREIKQEQSVTRSFSVRTRFVFDGSFVVKAENKTQAKEVVENHCGLVLGGTIHSSLPGDVIDWEFPLHPEKMIGRVTVKHKETI